MTHGVGVFDSDNVKCTVAIGRTRLELLGKVPNVLSIQVILRRGADVMCRCRPRSGYKDLQQRLSYKLKEVYR